MHIYLYGGGMDGTKERINETEGKGGGRERKRERERNTTHQIYSCICSCLMSGYMDILDMIYNDNNTKKEKKRKIHSDVLGI